MALTAHRRKSPAAPWRAAQGFITTVAVILGAVASVMLASQSTGTTPTSAAASNVLGGSSTITLQSSPEWVNGNVTDVVTGRVTCALRQGSVFCWGRGGHGLGNGSGASSVPAPVSAANGFQNSGVTHITAGTSLGGNDHMCAVESGKAFCWGSGSGGQIGNGTTTQNNFVPSPVSVANGFHNATVTAIAAGGLHTCAIEEQRVFCWGSNATGALGDGTTTLRTTPVAVMAQNGFQNSSVSAISAGYRHTCAIEEQRVFCWGANSTGALGDGTTTNKSTPVVVMAQNGFQNSSVSAITTGKSNNTSGDQSHTCALENGAVWCWGRNEFGKLGDGSTTNQTKPITVSAVAGGFQNTNVATISAGRFHTCAIEDSEAVTYCWGWVATVASAQGSP
jgi:alpha-tubulin suppressor-like RCC1 family protein